MYYCDLKMMWWLSQITQTPYWTENTDDTYFCNTGSKAASTWAINLVYPAFVSIFVLDGQGW